MIDSPWRLLAACGYGKFSAVREAEFAAVTADFPSPNECGKYMVQIHFLSNGTFDGIAGRATKILQPSHPAALSFLKVLETIT
jgi:hypothetical protein